jgi:hypothetical protein
LDCRRGQRGPEERFPGLARFRQPLLKVAANVGMRPRRCSTESTGSTVGKTGEKLIHGITAEVAHGHGIVMQDEVWRKGLRRA